MTSLNIDKYNENNENTLIWQETAGNEDRVAANNDAPRIEVVSRKPDLFELARTISYRANSRRRFRRSSSII
jgi:hypothetical protein